VVNPKLIIPIVVVVVVAVAVALIFLTPPGAPGVEETPTTPTTTPQQGGGATPTTSPQTPAQQIKVELVGAEVYVKDPTQEQLSRGVLAVVEVKLYLSVTGTGGLAELKRIVIELVDYNKNFTIERGVKYSPSPRPIEHRASLEIKDQDIANALKKAYEVKVYAFFDVGGKEVVDFMSATISRAEITETTPRLGPTRPGGI